MPLVYWNQNIYADIFELHSTKLSITDHQLSALGMRLLEIGYKIQCTVSGAYKP